MNLLIISHTPHYLQDGQVLGWGPTVREIDHLAALFERVMHLAVLYDEKPPMSSLPYNARNVSLIPVKPAGGQGWREKLEIVRSYPGYWWAIHRAVSGLKAEDVIHVRCPANLSLLALIYLTFNRRLPHRWIKYAGNWDSIDHEPDSYVLQKWLLEKGWHGGAVTINGRWPDQKSHICTFTNPSFENAELVAMQDNLSVKKLEPIYRFVFVGRVETPKGMGRAIEVCKSLHQVHVPFQLDILGDGPERPHLENLIKKAGMETHIFFHGWQSKTALQIYYNQAHFMLFPTSASEGWPKVLSEGMAYGVVPLAGAVSSIPQVLQECGTGMALDPLDTQAFVNAILSYIEDPERWKRESNAACRAAPQFTYETYLERLKAMFTDQWGVSL